ncbi:MAG TPA: zinc ABC transporter substrate-binding protein [Alphaproteobacteria bacterium]|jgi:zinc/manganese transport system substrate-binding protein|nr:zinc ABC transporter substrate-binding protein [Alphaproteobacteria bacterium]
MKRLLPALLFLGLMVSASSGAQARINIFACEPEWAALAHEIGGASVEIFTAVGPHQDPHYVRAKPSLIAAMRKADLVVCTGASLEIGWLPILLQKAGSSNVQPGGVGYLLAAEYAPILEKPERLDRAEGDIHPEGNPHVHLNPHNISLVVKELTARLQAVDPTHAAGYEANYAAFERKWREAITRWEADSAQLKGMRVVAHHKSFSYLLDWLDITEAGLLEVKPGIPPTTAHLEKLLKTLKHSPARLIVRTPYDPADASKWLSQKTGAPAILLPFTVGGDEQSGDLFRLFDRTLMLLMGAHGA